MTRWWVLLGFTVSAAIGGWSMLRHNWVPEAARLDCARILASDAVLQPADSSGTRFRLFLTLRETRPDVVLIYQIIDQNGFGWLSERVEPGSRPDRQRELFTGYPIRRVRVGVMPPGEHQRAGAIDRAAHSFQVAEWASLRGWQAPQLTLCQEFGV